MIDPDSLSETTSIDQQLAKKKDAAMKKVYIYILLTVATALSVMLWMYHGAVIALGFIFLEVQFLLVISTVGTSVGVLEQISAALSLLTTGDVDFHYHKQKAAGDEAEANFAKVVEKTAQAANAKR